MAPQKLQNVMPEEDDLSAEMANTTFDEMKALNLRTGIAAFGTAKSYVEVMAKLTPKFSRTGTLLPLGSARAHYETCEQSDPDGSCKDGWW